MLDDELREEVTQLRCLWLVLRGVVLDGLGATNTVDANDEGLHLCRACGRSEVECDQTKRDEGNEDERDLQIGVHDERGAVQLDELTLRVLKGFRTQIGDRGGHAAYPLSNGGRAVESGSIRSIWRRLPARAATPCR